MKVVPVGENLSNASKVYPYTVESSHIIPTARSIAYVAAWRLGGGEGLQEMELEETTPQTGSFQVLL